MTTTFDSRFTPLVIDSNASVRGLHEVLKVLVENARQRADAVLEETTDMAASLPARDMSGAQWKRACAHWRAMDNIARVMATAAAQLEDLAADADV